MYVGNGRKGGFTSTVGRGRVPGKAASPAPLHVLLSEGTTLMICIKIARTSNCSPAPSFDKRCVFSRGYVTLPHPLSTVVNPAKEGAGRGQVFLGIYHGEPGHGHAAHGMGGRADDSLDKQSKKGVELFEDFILRYE